MKRILVLYTLLLPFAGMAQPSSADILKYKIQMMKQDQDGRYGPTSCRWYYTKSGNDSLVINGEDTTVVKYIYKNGKIIQKISTHPGSREVDIYDYAYSSDGGYKITYTDGHFKMKSYDWYDTKRKEKKYQSPDGNVTTFQYNTVGKLISQVSNGYNQGTRINNKYQYNNKNQLIKIESTIDDVKTVTTYYYNAAGKLIKDVEKGKLEDDALENSSEYEYNDKGLKSKRTDKSIYPSNPKEAVVTFTTEYSYVYY